jgi:hypothetical protein
MPDMALIKFNVVQNVTFCKVCTLIKIDKCDAAHRLVDIDGRVKLEIATSAYHTFCAPLVLTDSIRRIN